MVSGQHYYAPRYQCIAPPTPLRANVGNRWGFANIRGYCLTPGADYKGETPPNPVLLYMGIRRDLLHSSYSHDSQVRLAGEIPSLGHIFLVNPYLIPVIRPQGGRWGYTLIRALWLLYSVK